MAWVRARVRLAPASNSILAAPACRTPRVDLLREPRLVKSLVGALYLPPFRSSIFVTTILNTRAGVMLNSLAASGIANLSIQAGDGGNPTRGELMGPAPGIVRPVAVWELRCLRRNRRRDIPIFAGASFP